MFIVELNAELPGSVKYKLENLRDICVIQIKSSFQKCPDYKLMVCIILITWFEFSFILEIEVNERHFQATRQFHK